MPTRDALDLEASLECELDGRPISIEARRGVIVVRTEDTQTARVIIKTLRGCGSLRPTLNRVIDTLLATSQRLELHVDNVVVASMGQGIGSGLLSLVGIRNVRIWPFRILWRRRSS